MMFKRILAAVMSAVIVLAMSSCGGNEAKIPEPELTEDGKKIVRIYTMYGNSETEEDITLFNKFNREYEVQLTELSSEYGDPIDQFNAAVAAGKYPDVIMYDRDGQFPMLLSYGYENFVDTAKGECRFDSGEFIRILKFCGQFPNATEPLSASEFHESQRKRVYAMRSGTMPFSTVNFSTFSEIRAIEQRDFYEPVTFIGLPGAGGNGSVIEPVIYKYSVLENGANSEGGWAFVKYLLTGNRQDRLVKYGPFAVKRTVLEAQAKEAQKLVWDSDEQDYAEPYCFDYTFDSDERPKKITVGVNTVEDNQRVYDLISGAVEVNYNSDVINIIGEEAGAYFAGQKSAEEVAKIIQNRVQNYIDESR